MVEWGRRWLNMRGGYYGGGRGGYLGGGFFGGRGCFGVEVEEDGSRSTDQYEVTIYVTNEAAGALIGN